MLLNPTGATIAPKRADTDFGENQWSNLEAIANAVVVPPQLFVPRGSDLKDGDQFSYQDTTYWVRGQRKWDMDHPLTGDDLGYVEFEISTER